jgi:Kef-type K+ transport system membrane component KefB
MPVFAQIFHEIAAVLGVSAILGALALWLRQPLLVAFMVVGLLVGPAGLGWGQTREQIDLLGDIGIALLLFDPHPLIL